MVQQVQYFLMTSLPPLPPLGESPPVGLGELYERVEGDDVKSVVGAVLLEHDLMQRQGVLSGELEQASPAVLTTDQVLGQAPLPAPLSVDEQGAARSIGDDATWEAYFRHVADTAGRVGCPFLRQWVGFEVALRNALVIARAKALDLTPEEYLVAEELADDSADVAPIVGQWSAAEDLLAAQRALDQGRWNWLNDHGGWFSFRIDEVAAYARGLVLLHRWQNLKDR